MGADRTRVVVLAAVAIALMLISALGLDWFTVEGARGGFGLGEANGLFSDTALWSAIVFALVVAYETALVLLGSDVPLRRVRWGYGVGMSALLCALAIAYVMPPEVKNAVVHRTWAPLVMYAGVIAGLAVGYYASGGGRDDFAGEYKPIVIAKEDSAPLPKSVIVERRSTPAGMKPIPHLRGKLAYSVMTAELSPAGIEARLEGGAEHLVMWRDVIGIVARRMPPDYDGVAFLDLVSTAGATLRLVPWTRYTGASIDPEPRALAKRLVAWCTRATLDPATKQFLDGNDPAAQLPDLTTLAAHDEKLA
jgi:hypothetical protein